MKFKKIIAATSLVTIMGLALTSCKEKKMISVTENTGIGTNSNSTETDSKGTTTTITNTGIETNKQTNDKTGSEINSNILSPSLDLSIRNKVSQGKTYYASPNGKTDAAGDKVQPFDLPSAFNHLEPGDTLIVMDGTYTLTERIVINGVFPITGIKVNSNKNGTPSCPITVKCDEGAKPVLDFSLLPIDDSYRGISLNSNYWRFYGLDIMGAGDNGMYIGGSYNIVENCTFHENQDTGLQLGRAAGSLTSVADWPHNNLIKNCTSYNNYDFKSFGENADGFAAKLTVGNANVFDGCIAYRNADDGWDLYAKSDTSNVGSTIIINCVAFENGWLLDKMPTRNKEEEINGNEIVTTRQMLEKTTNLSYTTRDGDGIGFKLGGSQMEGDVITRNCLSFNNRLHGFSDNSNPGILTLSNCTAFNNSVSVDPETGAILPSDNNSNNFDTARTDGSYNNYYGLLSYTTNQTNPLISYSNRDKFRGSCGYSIFNVGKDKYNTVQSYIDASSYDVKKTGKAYNDLSDSVFASLDFNYTVNGNRELHTQLRNSDFSINMASMCDVVDSNLLTYCQGKQIGSKLNYTSWDQYQHYDLSFFDGYETTEEEALLYSAKDALAIMCNPNAVYQDLNLFTDINGIKVSWESSNEVVVSVSDRKISTLSNVEYVKGIVYRDRESDKNVTLTATLEYKDYKIVKEFDLVVKQNVLEIGDVTGFEKRYIVSQFSDYELPQIDVLNASSYSGKKLINGIDYDFETTILYAQSKADFTNGNCYEVSKVYTSLTGTYRIIYHINSKIDNTQLEASYYIFVVSEDANIDISTIEDKPEYSVNVSRDGVLINAKLTNILGYMYAYASDQEVTSSEEVIQKGMKYDINDDSITAIYNMPNNSEYTVYFVVTNKNGGSVSKVYKEDISVSRITTNEEFNNLVSGQTNSTTIYLLNNDLDFTDYTFKTSTQAFGGLFNGNGHTIKNLQIEGKEKKDAAIFYKIKNGTVMNVCFENINIIGLKGTATIAGIIGQMDGGYAHNISLKNVSSSAHTAAGALVGQVCGGDNYISKISLVNDNDYKITVSGKYCGGIVANIQQDTGVPSLSIVIKDCYVKAVIGDGLDAGGYVGGIVGRIKNEYDTYNTQITNCYFEGQVMTEKNYCGGICAGTDNGAGNIIISKNVSNCTIFFAGTVLDGLSEGTMAAKNCSPVYGRKSIGLGLFVTILNYGPFADTQIPTDSEDFFSLIETKGFYNSIEFDFENTWEFNEETKTISLKTPVVAE